MYCELQCLYESNDAYVVTCRKCGHIQLAYISTILKLSVEEFALLRLKVHQACSNADPSRPEESKSLIIETTAETTFLALTRKEGFRFLEILEEADNEYKAQSMISLFSA